MRLAFALACVAVAGCQCLVPVDEDAGRAPDAGGVVGGGASGGGRAAGGAGSDAGAVGGGSGGGSMGGGAGGGPVCSSAPDCGSAGAPVIGFCGSQAGVWSCAFGACVAECNSPRTCTDADAGCMRCDGQLQCATPGTCPSMTHVLIEASTCGHDQETLKATSLSSQACTYLLQWPDGGVAGTATWFGFQDLRADLPDLGGECIGSQLPTGALRFSASCPTCMLSLMPLTVGP